jgi:phage FluMu protein Com
MAIEFRCTQCGKLLRTGDDTAGRQAKCPQCGTVMSIPVAGAAAGGDSPVDSGNPYQSPSPFTPPGPSQPQGATTPTLLDMGDMFSRTWSIFKQQWGMCLVALLVVLAISFAVNFIVGLSAGAIGAIARSPGLHFFANVVGNLATSLFGVWLGIGQAKYFLKIARGQPAEIADLFSGGPHFINILLASLLFGLIVGVGLLLCVVPGVILSLMFSQYYYLVLDRNVPVLESLGQSKELTNGNKLTLFLIWLVSGLVGMLLILVTCGLGLLVVAPYCALLHPVVYLAITGQRTADQLQSVGST